MSIAKIVSALALSLNCCFAAEPTVTFYSSDPAHLWNRLYAALMVRTTLDGIVQDDLLDPPLWSATKHLLTGESNRRAVALLTEFAHDRERLAEMKPIHRALMQRDLLGVFCWLMAGGYGPQRVHAPEHRALASALARAIDHTALSAEEIAALPDLYSAALTRPGVATAFAAEDSGRPFLPKDLLTPEGPWIAVESLADDALPATRHFQEFRGRSMFEVFFFHPEGRAAGEAYLAQLAAMPEPWASRRPENIRSLAPNSNPDAGPWPNPETPQFPPGSMWALLRRAMLVSREGKPIASPLVESVQVRVYVAIAPGAQEAQRFSEWEMRRALVLGDGGFVAIAPGEQRYRHFMTHGIDPFETNVAGPPGARPAQMLNCFACHTAPGIHSVVSRNRLFEVKLVRPPEFHPTDRAKTATHSESAAGQMPVWKLLRWMMTGH